MPLTDAQREACEWYLRALADLRDARHLREDEPASPNVVWLAQQAAEKVIKCLLILHQVPFPRIHELDILRELLPGGYRLKTHPPDLSELTQYATGSRYPGEFFDEHLINEEVVAIALEQAGEVVSCLQREFDQGLLAQLPGKD